MIANFVRMVFKKSVTYTSMQIMLIFLKCYVKPGKADIVQIPFKQNQAEGAANSTKCIDISPKVTKVRSHFLLLRFYSGRSTLGDLCN